MPKKKKKEIFKLSSEVVVPFCFPANSEGEFLLLHNTANIWYCGSYHVTQKLHYLHSLEN